MPPCCHSTAGWLRVAELGQGAAEVLSRPASGRVVAVFRRAAYLRFPLGMVALTSMQVPSGPIHLRSRLPIDRLRPGDPVGSRDGCLSCAGDVLPLGGIPVWSGPLPDAVAAGPAAGVLGPCGGRSALLAPTFARRLRSAARSVGDGDVEGASRFLGGLGPGLTPSGDDALAGILLAARVRWTSTEEERLVGIAAGVATHDLARAFLVWAARGQSILPVHRCLTALAAGDVDAARAACTALAAYGHTSGADLALGLLLGLVLLPADGYGDGRAGPPPPVDQRTR
jgi:hypothetical protein